MAESDAPNRFSPDDDDATQILEALRERVRTFGFAEADLALQDRLEEFGARRGLDALEVYFHGLDSYFQIFRGDRIDSTTQMLSEHLEGRFDWWRLRRGGDRENFLHSEDTEAVVVEDLRKYAQVEALLTGLRTVMKQLGIPGPRNGGNDFSRSRRRPQ